MTFELNINIASFAAARLAAAARRAARAKQGMPG